MKTTARKIGNSIGTILPKELNPKVGTEYDVYKVEDTIIMVPSKSKLFDNPEEWKDFRKSITKEDRDWDEMED
ncbi:antitoxin MazE [Lentilactobacillus otakiensis]|uniref:SpoVT-AbrB domain-containing protein n=1 Tax=Lentilactobacillus otakiensis DSM 19908 = JCM 15040 TaxID=1423780 RepID=S4NF25_9LACO|nr:hypothetical protein [Lentilactobacillus otakiensis]MBZ3776294.1 antitoxin MazE [Lentilactobacillus otakiensis]MDV3517282.1 antitoxin MazE [Lentilactobacillus otakiensis]GAD17589.1 hypothetical protein LOT_2127 [Lentilactobacillus otakiensis DSM 19908 = JCM 15040]